MSITKLQDKTINIGTPVEIKKACNDIRLDLSNLSWIDKPFLIAERFYRKKNNREYFYPETYVGGENKPYHRLTPDNDYRGSFFFFVGDSTNQFNSGQYNFITYPVAIIFQVNLKKIDENILAGDPGYIIRHKNELFTQELIREARRLLTNNVVNYDFSYSIVQETTDLQRVYREFVLEKIENYNRAPLQCFRFDLSLTIQEECI